MLDIAICDDDDYYINRIYELVKLYLEKRQIEYRIDLFSSGLKLLENRTVISKYNIIFLDIKLNDINGMEVAKEIRVFDTEIFIVFISSYADYFQKGYVVEAFRYILKSDLERPIMECMNAILFKIKIKTEKMEFAFTGGIIELNVNQILYIESDNRILRFYLIDSKKKYIMYEKLDYIEEKLKEYEFLRIRKSQLVNMNYIHRINSYQVELTTKENLVIPKDKYGSVKEEFNFLKGRMR